MKTGFNLATGSMKSLECNVKKFNNYFVLNCIGQGTFGRIYSVVDQNSCPYAIKIAEFNRLPNQHKLSINYLSIEYQLLTLLKNENGFVKCFAFEHSLINGQPFLVMEKLYKNLQQLFYHSNKSFTMKTILHIALQTISRIETVHQFK